MDKPLPSDMHDKWGHLQHLRHKGSEEWSAACPKCGTAGHDPDSGVPDRFMIWGANHHNNRSGKPHGKCRKCGHLEWLDDTPVPVSPQQQAINNYAKRKKAKAKEQTYKQRIEWLNQQQFWLDAHVMMTDKQRKLWHDTGVGDWAIVKHKLGVVCDYKDYGESLTIPYHSRSNGHINTVQFRLLHPPKPNDKYRWMKGTRPQVFWPYPDDPITKVILVTEGVKKGIITYQEAGHLTYQGEPITIVSVPNKSPEERLVKQLANVEVLIWMLDPDAYEDVKANGKTHRAEIHRCVKLAETHGDARQMTITTQGKIDDLFLMGNLEPRTFQFMLNQAVPYLK